MEKIHSFASVQINVLAEEAIQTLSSFSKMGFSPSDCEEELDFLQNSEETFESSCGKCSWECYMWVFLSFWRSISLSNDSNQILSDDVLDRYFWKWM
jgi:hypothetical protein